MSDYEDTPEEAQRPVAGNPETNADDPIEEALYTSFMQAQATGADASQAFNVGIYAAKQVALDAGIPEMIFEQIASDLFGPYSNALGEGQSPQEALRSALKSLED
jgi:hypothetical protein